MVTYQAKFTGGTVNALTQIITTHDSLHGNKAMTLTFYNTCPGNGLDAPLGTTVRLSAACYLAIEAAVNGNHTVQLDGTSTSITPSVSTLSGVVHAILT